MAFLCRGRGVGCACVLLYWQTFARSALCCQVVVVARRSTRGSRGDTPLSPAVDVPGEFPFRQAHFMLQHLATTAEIIGGQPPLNKRWDGASHHGVASQNCCLTSVVLVAGLTWRASLVVCTKRPERAVVIDECVLFMTREAWPREITIFLGTMAIDHQKYFLETRVHRCGLLIVALDPRRSRDLRLA